VGVGVYTQTHTHTNTNTHTCGTFVVRAVALGRMVISNLQRGGKGGRGSCELLERGRCVGKCAGNGRARENAAGGFVVGREDVWLTVVVEVCDLWRRGYGGRFGGGRVTCDE